MSKFHTNLTVSQKLARLGVKAESEKYWKQFDPRLGDDQKGWKIQSSKDNSWLTQLPAYSLSELADVLREVEEIKEWEIMNGSVRFIAVCQEFLHGGESAANKYLEEII